MKPRRGIPRRELYRREIHRREIHIGSLLFCAALGVASLLAQSDPSKPQSRDAEITTTETAVTFRSGTNLVPVPVVVRDSKGRAIGNLTIDDFQLFDNGKQQMISKFSAETMVGEPVKVPDSTSGASTKQNSPSLSTATVAGSTTAVPGSSPDGIPDRFVAYLFDDLHMSLNDLVYTRDAAGRQIDSSLTPMSRAAIYTTSGHQMLEFTGDREKLHATLNAINAGAAAAAKALKENSCPPVDYYMGDRIYNKHDLTAWKLATKDAASCGGFVSTDLSDPSSNIQESDVSGCEASGAGTTLCKAVMAAKQSARMAVLAGDHDTEASLEMLRAVVTRMSAMPGQRSLVVVSSGFLVLDDRRDEQMALIERAIKAKVVIGGLDARGGYTQSQGGDASDRVNSHTIMDKLPYVSLSTLMQTDVMASLADGTGGNFYHGTNDFDEGFARLAAAPEYIYVLGFSPLGLKPDGRFHDLKVTLKTVKGMNLQVRKGYFAPRTSTDPASQAKQQIEETFFSRDQLSDLPATLQTQYFKAESGDVTLSAVAKVDIKKLTFRKDGDRNRNDITVITGIFDNDGNYVTGARKVVEMRLLDETLQKRAASGIAVKNSFAVHPGRYVVRMVVRDSEGQLMSAQSSLVEIP
jgi:VWFA-related protein